MANIISWMQANWQMVIAALWALDQLLVSILGQSTLLDTITSVLKGLGGGNPPAAGPQIKG